MKYNYIIYFFLILLVNRDNSPDRIEYYKSGKVLVEKYRVNDSTINIYEYYKNGKFSENSCRDLKKDLESLKSLPSEKNTKKKYEYILELDDGRKFPTDLFYEITELEKDICFIEKGEDNLYALLEKFTENFSKNLKEVTDFIKQNKIEGDPPVLG